MLDKIFALSFILFLSLFGLLTLTRLGEKEVELVSQKNIDISFKQDYSLENITEVVSAHMDHRVGYRSSFYDILSALELQLFNRSIKPNKVLIGKEGWSYLGNDFAKVVETSAGMHTYTAEEISSFKNSLAALRADFKRKGIEFAVVIAPNKHSIYPEYLPYSIRQETNLDRLEAQAMPHFINLKPALVRNKKKGRLYHKTNSHWNSFGAFYAYRSVIRQLNTYTDLSLNPLHLRQMKFDSIQTSMGDLMAMIKSQNKEMRVRSRLRKSVKEYAYSELDTNVNFPTQQNPNFETILQNSKCDNNCLDKTILFRDSFGKELMKLLLYNTKQLHVIHSQKLDLEYIYAQDPDLVIYELVERNMDALFDL